VRIPEIPSGVWAAIGVAALVVLLFAGETVYINWRINTFDQITVGMTETEAREIMGEPDHERPPESTSCQPSAPKCLEWEIRGNYLSACFSAEGRVVCTKKSALWV
jgi:hypothetical protein